MSDALARIADLVRAESGVRAARPALARAIGHLAPRLDPAEFLTRVATEPDLVPRLLDEVTVQESFFWRDERQLATIDWRALLAGARRRGSQTIQVWSAGCAGGDEPYTLALQAMESLGTATPPVRILGTDVSRAALDRAAAGVYRERSLRLVPRRVRLSRFELGPHATMRIGEAARALVRFDRHNLVRDPVPAPGACDLVLCRNVLIYFDAPTAAAVLDRLGSALAPGGMLLLGAADRLCVPPAPVPAETPRPRTRVEAKAGAVEPLFADGLAQLVRGNVAGAVTTLRRVVYLEPLHAAAAFQLGRAHEAAGDAGAARRAYGQALRTLAEHPADDRTPEQVSAGDIAAACTFRMEALS
jgi:chemotaxis methyl-accepting protein methylase